MKKVADTRIVSPAKAGTKNEVLALAGSAIMKNARPQTSEASALDKRHITLLHNKLREFAAVIPILAAESGIEVAPCGCCLKLTPVLKLNCAIIEDEPGWVWTWVCFDCQPEATATDGGNIKRASRVVMEELEEQLLFAAKVVDAAILKRNKYDPFVRRPTCAEILRWGENGLAVDRECVVVVTRGDEAHLHRRLLPMPFPWRGHFDWLNESDEAFDLAILVDAIDRREAEVTVFPSGFCIAAMDHSETADALLAGGCYE